MSAQRSSFEQTRGRATLDVGGMTCSACAQSVEESLVDVEGVEDARVNLPAEKAYVTYDSSQVGRDALIQAVEGAGYQVRKQAQTVILGVEGMTCAACVRHVENALEGTEGVQEASVNLEKETATVTLSSSSAVDFDDLAKAVVSAGYGVRERKRRGQEPESDDEHGDAARKMRTAWLVSLPLIAMMIPEMFFGLAWPSESAYHLLLTALSLAVLLGPGRETLARGYASILRGAPNMDALISLGTMSAWITGPMRFSFPLANYAGVGAMIMAFHLTGRFIEAKARGRTSQAIRKLLELGADTATLLVKGEEVVVEVDEIAPGDLMVVRPGEKIPTDGLIVEGETSIDESVATGESVPVDKGPGDEVIGATINKDGFIKVEATKVGQDTFLSQVVKLVEAQGTKVPVQALADRIIGVFVPAIVAAAFLTFVSWLVFPDFFRSLTVWASRFLPWLHPEADGVTLAVSATIATLVIACPCALGLATPTALMVATGKGAENGVLIRSGEAIQTMKDVDTIVFDKTGTITQGRLEVTDVFAEDGDELLALAAGVESGSEHPLGEAMLREAERRNVSPAGSVSGFQAVPGKGVRGRIDGEEILVGNETFLRETSVEVPDELRGQKERLEGEGKTAVYCARSGRAEGVIAVADVLKEDSVPAIGELRAMGFEVAMITGDNERTARAIANTVGIERVLAGVLPEGKVDEVRRLQDEVGKVAMVGDGINDAPALTQADVGIAIGTGTDIAIESSDITLVSGDLSAVVTAVKLSRQAFRKIRQNLFWAFLYNLAAIPVAMAGMLHPLIAEAAMAFSSITVVSNANLLQRADVKPDYEGRVH